MYQPDSRDTLVTLTDVPQCDVGAPLPVVLADESTVQLAYSVSEPAIAYDAERNDIVNYYGDGELFAVVRFHSPRVHFLGPPNNEAAAGHPLHTRGFQPHSAMEVLSSSWVRNLERMNSVHKRHSPESFARDRHFIFAFHDSTFECVAMGFEVTTLRGPLAAVLSHMLQRVDPDAA